MSPERRKSASKGQRRASNRALAEARRERFLTGEAHEKVSWDKFAEGMKKKFPNYQEDFAPHEGILREFFEIRNIQVQAEQTKKISEFREKYDPELLKQLSPAFKILTR